MPTYTAAVAGYEELGVWNAVDPLKGDPGTVIGLSFEVPVTLATGRDIALDPPIFTSMVGGLYVQALDPPGAPGDNILIYAGVVDEPNPPRFGASPNLPNEQEAAYGLRDLLLVTSTSLVVPGWVDLTYPLAEFQSNVMRSGWQGRINLFMRVFDLTQLFTDLWVSNSGALVPRLVTEEGPFLSGISGPVDAYSRVDRCGKCGLIDVRENFVRDGYSTGLWVCQECYDPAEPARQPIPPDVPPIND